MPSLAFQTLPITYSSLVIETTTKCNAKCDVCYQYSGPKGSDKWGVKWLDEKILKKVISESINIRSLVKRFHLAGGECFLDLDFCLKLFSHSKLCGFSEITATTNAFWATSYVKTSKILSSLRGAGLTKLEISWDIWHKKYIKQNCIENLVNACADHNVSTNLRVLTTKEFKINDSLSCLNNSTLNKVDEISCCPVFFTGRATEQLNEKSIYSPLTGFSGCYNVLNLTINPKGFVFPCCAGLDQTDHLNFGNIYDDSIVNIVEKMNSSLLLRILVFEGPVPMLKILKQYGITLPLNFKNVCHMCWHIFNDKRLVDIIIEHFDKIYLSSIERAITKITDNE